jgi:hypothetical protein
VRNQLLVFGVGALAPCGWRLGAASIGGLAAQRVSPVCHSRTDLREFVAYRCIFSAPKKFFIHHFRHIHRRLNVD